MALHNVLGPSVGIRVRAETRVVRPKRLVGGVRNSIPLIETLICRKPAFRVAQVPLAESAGGVTGVREHSGHCDFPLHGAIVKSIDRYRAVTRANCVPPSHQSCTARRALRLDVVVQQAHPFSRQLVDSRGRRAAQNPPRRTHRALPNQGCPSARARHLTSAPHRRAWRAEAYLALAPLSFASKPPRGHTTHDEFDINTGARQRCRNGGYVTASGRCSVSCRLGWIWCPEHRRRRIRPSCQGLTRTVCCAESNWTCSFCAFPQHKRSPMPPRSVSRMRQCKTVMPVSESVPAMCKLP